MKRYRYLWTLLILSSAISCHQGRGDMQETIAFSEDPAPQLHVPAQYRSDIYWQRIVDIINQSPKCHANITANPYCEKLKVYAGQLYQEGRLRDDQRILVIDDFSSSAIIHFNHRIRSTYAVSETGEYKAAKLSGTVYRGAWEIAQIIAEANEPIEKYQNASNAYLHRYGDIFKDHAIAHGNVVLEILAIYNPEAEFVLAMGEHNEAFIDYFCRRDFKRLRQLFQQRASSLTKIILDENIHFINYSSGFSQAQVKKAFADLCGQHTSSEKDIAEFLAIDRIFLKAIANIPHVAMVQAATSVPAGANPYTFAPNDCNNDEFKNRLRVAYLTGLAVDIAQSGEPYGKFKNNIPEVFQNARPCIDVYLNARMERRYPFRPDTQPLYISDGGLGLIPLPAPATSYLSPLAVSRLINIRETIFPFRSMSSELVNDMFETFTQEGQLQLQDPLKHHDLEKFRILKVYHE